MTPFSEKELYPARTIADQAAYDAAIEARRIEGLNSGRFRRVESPCVAETLRKRSASVWLYMRTHMWVWIVASLLIVGAYVLFTL